MRMDTLQEQIDAAEQKLLQLKRQQETEDCRKVGCHFVFMGGKNACCEIDGCGCSVPVYGCPKCGDSDYGDNAEACEIREQCKQGHPNL
jgi:hypothetical protein